MDRTADILILVAIGAGITVTGCAGVVLWSRIMRRAWPDRVTILSTAIGLIGITLLGILSYLILEH